MKAAIDPSTHPSLPPFMSSLRQILIASYLSGGVDSVTCKTDAYSLRVDRRDNKQDAQRVCVRNRKPGLGGKGVASRHLSPERREARGC